MGDNYRFDNEDRPIMSFRGVRTVIVFLAVVFGVGYVAMKLMSSQTLPIRYVEIGGEFRYVDRTKVKKLVGPLIKGNFFTVNIKAIHQSILKQMWVDTVSVRRIWPDKIRIMIEEEKPLARWAQGGLITKEGEHMATRVRGSLLRLPYFKGPNSYKKVMAENYMSMRRSFAKANMDITQLVVSPRRSWSLRLENGILVRVGKDEVVSRVERLSKVFDSVLRNKVKDIQAIDLRYANGFAVQWKSTKTTKRFAFGG